MAAMSSLGCQVVRSSARDSGSPNASSNARASTVLCAPRAPPVLRLLGPTLFGPFRGDFPSPTAILGSLQPLLHPGVPRTRGNGDTLASSAAGPQPVVPAIPIV